MSLIRVPRGLRLLGAATAVGLFSLVVTASPAHAAGAFYGTWTVSGANPSWAGTVNVPAVGFPPGSFTTDSNTPRVPGGDSIFLGPATPFGSVFGSSRGQQYLGLGTAAGQQPSTTNFTFDYPTPAGGWGFNLGDVDADHVHVTATGPEGPLSSDDLGFQSGYNLCAFSPQPPGCTRPPFTDIPTWDPATMTLSGNVADTDGAAGWFRPTKPITSLTFGFELQSGIPSYQIWFAALTSNVCGGVTLQTPDGPVPAPPTTKVVLTPNRNGAAPISTTPVDASGNFCVAEVVQESLLLTVEPPPGYKAPPPQVIDPTQGDVLGLAISLAPKTPPAPPPAPGPPVQPLKPMVPPGRTIPATGGITDVLTPVGIALVAVGFGCLRLARRYRPRHIVSG